MPDDRRIHFAPFALDPVNECLWKGGTPIRLRPKAYAVLERLVGRPGELVTKQDLLDAVWPDTFVGDAVLKVAIRQIREALADDPQSPRFIETAHRRGYRFIAPIDALEESASAPPVGGPVTASRREPPRAFVGRNAALTRLHAIADKARAGETQIVFVTGEAGIGKTTLVHAFAAGLAGMRICSGQCLEQYGMSEPYLPVLDAIGQLCREDPRAVDVVRTQAPMWLVQMPAFVTAADRDLLGRDAAAATRERMLREMGEALAALTVEAPLVLLLEDLHWSDFSTLDLISYLARARRNGRLLVLGTYRPAELIASRHPLRGVKQELIARQQCEEVPLEYLSVAAIAEHVDARFPGHRFPPELIAFIHDRTEGNPLFMVNTIDHLIDEGLIERVTGGWRLTAPIDTVKLGVPESIRQLIETHVERLDDEEQRVLEAASVAGAEFPAAAVAAALAVPLAEVEARCEALSRRHQFITESGTHRLPDGQVTGRFAFVHAVYRHVLYERITGARRMQWHRAIARRGEEVYGTRAVEIAAELAMHFEECADYLQAAHYLHHAARNAMSRWAYGEAVAVARRGLDLLAAVPDDDERARRELALRIVLGVPLIAMEGYAFPEVGELYRGARALCLRLGVTSELSQVLWGLWTFHAVKAELATALTVAEELLTLSRDGRSPELAMRGHWAMEITCAHRGQFERALEHFETALGLIAAMRDRDELPADALNPGVATRCFAAWSFWFVGRPDTAVVTVNEAVALARRLADPHGLSHALVFAAVLHQLRREPVVARQHAEAAIALSSGHRLPLYEGMGRVVRGWAMSMEQDLSGALIEIRRGLEQWEGTNARVMLPYFLALAAEVSTAAALEDAAMDQLDQALACSAATGERFYDAELHRLRGERLLHLDASNMTAAVACFEQARAVAREQRAQSLELRTAMSLARLDRDGEENRSALHAAFTRFSEGLETPDLRDAALLLGTAAAS